MKKYFSLFITFMLMMSILTTTVSAASPSLDTPTPELGQLKICKVAGSGVNLGTLFTFNVNGNRYQVPAGPADFGYCVLAGQYPVNTQLTIEEMTPDGFYVARIEVKPDRVVSKDTANGKVVLQIGSGVTEAIFTNKVAGPPTPTRTPTSVNSVTPAPTKTATATPSCSPNCTPTSTSVPKGRLQICKEADGEGVTGYFTFKFETRSTSVPVGACAGLISVNAGKLTITEVPQTGYALTDVYTIPGDRLISKNLSGGKATVTIVEGTAASQTIVIFRNRVVPPDVTFTPSHTATSTQSLTPTGTLPTNTPTLTPTNTVTGTPPTNTPTFTPANTVTGTPPTHTPTNTPSSCPATPPPAIVNADFNLVPVGQSVEGMGKVAPNLNIDGKDLAVKVQQGLSPTIYVSSLNGVNTINGYLVSNGGFSDLNTRNAGQPHLYAFTLAPGTTASSFAVRMLDFGDINPQLTTNHTASFTAYDANGVMVATQTLNYNTPAILLPTSSDLYGNMQASGDASAAAGLPGKWSWHVSGAGIAKVVLQFGAGFDPNIAFDTLTFTTVCP